MRYFFLAFLPFINVLNAEIQMTEFANVSSIAFPSSFKNGTLFDRGEAEIVSNGIKYFDSHGFVAYSENHFED